MESDLEIKTKNVEKVIGKKLEKLGPDEITKTISTNSYSIDENENIIGLNLNSLNITDASFLKEFKNLTSLYLSSNQISDYSFLKDLENLTTLDLSLNQLSDISFLKNLEKLEILNLGNNQIKDISSLKDLKNLTTLNLRNNQITDISSLEDLENLTTLNLSFNEISNYSCLRKLKNLTTLNLWNNHLTEKDISFLEDLTSLTKLELYNTQLSDFSVIKDLRELTTLDLWNNQISDISFLKDLKKLELLNLKSNQISDILPLKDLKKLKKLDLRDNKIEDLPKELKELLEELNLEINLNRNPIDGINLYGNPLNNRLIEAIKEGKNAIRGYFKSPEEGGEQPHKETKVQPVGDKGTGKTPIEYSFIWDDVQEDDKGRFIDLLRQYYGIDWAKTAKIEKIDDGNTIEVSREEDYLSLKLNNEKTKVNLKIDSGITDELIAEKENGKLNIYLPKNISKSPFGYDLKYLNYKIFEKIFRDRARVPKEKQMDILNKAYRDERLVLVLGAGVSRDHGLPDWNTLLQKLLMNTIASEKMNTIAPEKEEILRLARLFIKTFSPSPLVLARYIKKEKSNFFEEAVRGAIYEQIRLEKELDLFKEIRQLCVAPGKSPNLDSIITYNYDDILEYYLSKLNVELPFKPIYSVGMNPAQGEFPIYHVHGYLPSNRFSWDDIPGKDDDRLIDILKQNYSIDWAKIAKIEKIDDGNTIKVSTEKNSLSLKLNDEKEKVNLTIDNGRTDSFNAKMENGKLTIYGSLNGTNKITLSEDIYHQQYNEVYSWNNIIQINKFRDNICLFIGVSLTDPNLRRLLDIVMVQKRDSPSHHFIIKKKYDLKDVQEIITKLFKEDRELSDDKLNAYLEQDKDIAKVLKEIMENFEERDALSFGVNTIWVEDFHECSDILKNIRRQW